MNENTTAILKVIDDLIDELANSTEPLSKESLDLITEIADEVARLKADKSAQEREAFNNNFDRIVSGLKENNDISTASIAAIVSAVEKIKLEPPAVTVNVPDVHVPPVVIPPIATPKIPEIQVNVPPVVIPPIELPEIHVAPPDLTELTALLQKLLSVPPTISFPKKANDPLAVRLSDGEKFYRSMGSVMQAVGNANVQTSVNNIDDTTVTSVTYIGKEDDNAQWSILKIDETGSFPVFTYASIINNTAILGYTNAWSKRLTVTYGTYAQSKRS